MVRNEYRARWAQWLPSALEALAKDPPDYGSVMPLMPTPELSKIPFSPAPRERLRVSLITSSGAYDTQQHGPFAASSIVGDPTHRVIATHTPPSRLGFAHEHFDHASAKADLEAIIPRKTLQALSVELAPHFISWTGYLLDWPTFIEATVPQILKQAQLDRANAAVIVPI